MIIGHHFATCKYRCVTLLYVQSPGSDSHDSDTLTCSCITITTTLQTCSFVVRPRATRTIWKPVRPTMGTHSKPTITIIHILQNSTVHLIPNLETKLSFHNSDGCNCYIWHICILECTYPTDLDRNKLNSKIAKFNLCMKKVRGQTTFHDSNCKKWGHLTPLTGASTVYDGGWMSPMCQ